MKPVPVFDEYAETDEYFHRCLESDLAMTKFMGDYMCAAAEAFDGQFGASKGEIALDHVMGPILSGFLAGILTILWKHSKVGTTTEMMKSAIGLTLENVVKHLDEPAGDIRTNSYERPAELDS